MREHGLIEAEIEQVIEKPDSIEADDQGKPRYLGLIRGLRVRIVLALDQPDLVVTIHSRRK